jgi:hypothetical protein
MEAQRRAAAAAEEGAGIWATGFSFFIFFFWFQDWRALGAKPANACKGRTSIKALLRPKLN